MRRLLRLIPAAALLAAGCSNPQYLHISMPPLPAPTGTNCGSPSTDVTYNGVQTATEWVIYSAPKDQYLLDGVLAGDFLTGTNSGGTYTFTGTDTYDNKGTIDVTTTTIDKVTLTTSQSGGVTGTFTHTESCKSGNNMACLGGDTTSTTGADYDCSASVQFSGTSLGNVAPTHVVESGSSAG